MMRLARIAICLTALLSSPLLLVQGLANAEQAPGSPEHNGFWMADIARLSIEAEAQQDTLRLVVREGGVELARSAYSAEPLATDALFVVAVDRRSEGDLEAMEHLIGLGVSLDKRNENLGALQLELAARDGDLSEAFSIIDRLSLTHPRLIPDFLQVFSQVVLNEDALPILRERIDRNPRWAAPFWLNTPLTAETVGSVYELRQMTSTATTQESDARLLSALGVHGRFEEAMAFWEMAFSGATEDTLFLPSDDFPPIGWRLVSSGERSLSAREGGAFEVYVKAETFGELARQLVRLEPGEYEFMARITPRSHGEDVDVSLVCAETGQEIAEGRPIIDKVVFTINASCEAYWLLLTGSAWETSGDLRANITHISLEKVKD